MKKVVKLTEDKLRKMIAETVNALLESETPILHGEGNGEVYRDDAFVTDWRDNPNDDPNKVKAPYNSYVWNKKFSKHYPTPESFWNPKDTRAYKYTRDLDKIHREEDKLKKSEDLKTQRALDAADSRPLHRKGSLNRVGMNENVIGKLVSESIKKVLNEKWYPEDDDDISDYSFGMIAKLTTRNDFELDEETIAKLENIQDEYAEYSDSYVSVMVRNVTVSCNQYGDCSLTIECAVSAPDMPIHEIEQEVEEILWYWIEEQTGKSLVSGFDWESEDTVFDRRSRNK